jgi:hypothetical protein
VLDPIDLRGIIEGLAARRDCAESGPRGRLWCADLEGATFSTSNVGAGGPELPGSDVFARLVEVLDGRDWRLR